MAALAITVSAGQPLTLRLARIGSFFAGGRRISVDGEPVRQIRFSAQAATLHDPNGTFHIEQAYVQSFIPEEAGSRAPVVLIHGGCLTGAMWETTPDGRPGWLELFLRAGLPMHVVDGVERGRAGWCSLPGVWPEAPVARSAEEMWSLYRLGPARERHAVSWAAIPGGHVAYAAHAARAALVLHHPDRVRDAGRGARADRTGGTAVAQQWRLDRARSGMAAAGTGRRAGLHRAIRVSRPAAPAHARHSGVDRARGFSRGHAAVEEPVRGDGPVGRAPGRKPARGWSYGDCRIAGCAGTATC